MSSDWKISELGNEAINASRPFPFKQYSKVVFVNTGDVHSGKFLQATISDSKGLPGQAKKALKQDDILLSEIRPGNGRFAYVDFDVSNYVVSTKFMVIESLGRVSSRFLYHVLTNQAALNEFQRIAESRSGTFPQITFDSISHFPIPIPSEAEQAQLVEFLDALDDQIKLLSETNKTIEAIAQAIYKSWFIDFDPVLAKMEGRAPVGLDEKTAALFPDELVQSELGLIPKGWSCTDLSNVCSYLSRGLSPKYTEVGGVLVLNQKCVRDFSVDYTKGRRHDLIQRKVDGRLLEIGDVLVNSTGVGTLGRVAQILSLDEPAIVDSHLTVVRAGQSVSWPYLGECMKKMQPTIESMGEGSTGQTELSRGKLGGLKIIVPATKVQGAFDSIVGPMKASIALNVKKSFTLSQLRDLLLPRLISGKLRLLDADSVEGLV